MVELSPEAAVLIRRLVADRRLPDSAGLRLCTGEGSRSLSLALAAGPDRHDLVLTRHGASLFVSPTAVQRVGQQTLRAQVEGRPAFFVD